MLRMCLVAKKGSMAKKTILSDFSALKGKVTFSEKESVSMSVPKEKSSHRNSKKEGTVKVGQKVVLMDSDLRGKIVSLGKTVGIELDDGLIIEAAYREFAITDEHEISVLKQSKAKPKKTMPSAKSKISTANSNTLVVDLHIEAISGSRTIPKGQQLQFQMDTFRKIVRENLHHRGMSITFIHGIGDGILKAAIRKELDEVLALRCSYSVGDPAVTVVSMK
jgi:hypothetical protein